MLNKCIIFSNSKINRLNNREYDFFNNQAAQADKQPIGASAVCESQGDNI